MFPNPAAETVFVGINPDITAKTAYVVNLSGQIVYTINFGTDVPLIFQIDCSNFTTGMYMIVLQSDNNLFTTRFIKK